MGVTVNDKQGRDGILKGIGEVLSCHGHSSSSVCSVSCCKIQCSGFIYEVMFPGGIIFQPENNLTRVVGTGGGIKIHAQANDQRDSKIAMSPTYASLPSMPSSEGSRTKRRLANLIQRFAKHGGIHSAEVTLS